MTGKKHVGSGKISENFTLSKEQKKNFEPVKVDLSFAIDL